MMFDEEAKNSVRELLRNGEVDVTFTKKDGSERKMTCTLKEDKIPSEKAPKNAKKSQSKESIAVFDVEKQDWRSFRFDSIKDIHTIIEKV